MIEAPRSILVLKPSSFGDIVHTLPAVAWLKFVWPTCRLTWLVNTEWAPLLAGNPDVDEVVEFPRRNFRGVRGLLRFGGWCRENVVGRKPELALDYQGLLRSAVLGRSSGPGLFCGLCDAREGARWWYDRVAPTPPGVPHAVDRYLRLTATALAAAGIDPTLPPRELLTFRLPTGTVPVAWPAGMNEPYVVLHPFARGAGKSLTAAQIEAFCRRLAPRQVVLVGRRDGSGFAAPAGVVDLLDQTTLLELIWALRGAAGIVSVDSGPSHLAAALDKPLVAIHTWSDPRRVGPYRDDAWVWKNGRLIPMRATANLEDEFFPALPVALTVPDMETIGDRIISLSGFCA